MAIADADRMKVYSAMTAKELREKSLMYNLLDRTWEAPYAAGAASVFIPKPDWATNTTPNPDEGVTPADRARGGNWATTQNIDQDLATLTRHGGVSASNQVLWEDALELPWAAVERTRNRQMWALRQQVDTKMYDAARGAASNTLTLGAAGDTFISRTAPYAATIADGSNHPAFDAVRRWGLLAYRLNAVEGDPSPTGVMGMPFIILAPEVTASLGEWLLDKRYHFDPLTAEILRQNPGMTGMGYLFNLFGVRVYSWNHLSVPTGNNNWEGYAALPQACAVGLRPPIVQYFPPAANQVSGFPAHLMRQALDYAWVEVEDGWHRKIAIHAD